MSFRADVLTLYHHGSSACAAKVRFALAEKHLDWRSCYVDILKGEQFAPHFRALNPKAVVPVLVHDDWVLPESTIICEYLDEAFTDHPIYPRSPRRRAEARNWTKAVDEELHPTCSAITYIVSHRHTIQRQGALDFEKFLEQGGAEGRSARLQKWQWIQHGIQAPGAADKIRLYDAYLHKMEAALSGSDWLVGNEFSVADITMTPYVNRLHALALEGLWIGGRLPRVADWFERIRDRPTFKPSFVDWMPTELTREMHANGEKSWPQIHSLLSSAGPRA
jgi:ganglioside-induced differentiation-associated protein 1